MNCLYDSQGKLSCFHKNTDNNVVEHFVVGAFANGDIPGNAHIKVGNSINENDCVKECMNTNSCKAIVVTKTAPFKCFLKSKSTPVDTRAIYYKYNELPEFNKKIEGECNGGNTLDRATILPMDQ